MKRIRYSVFETNSSNTHSFTIHIGRFGEIHCYDEYERDDIYLEEEDIDSILDYLPTERIEEYLKEKKKADEQDKLWSEYFAICDECKNCIQKSTLKGEKTKCRQCDKNDRKIEIYNTLYPNKK